MGGKTHHRKTQDAEQRVTTIRSQTQDSFANLAARVGMGADNLAAQSTYVQSNMTSNRRQLEAAYRGSWVCGAIIDMPAEDMTRAGIEFTGGDVSAEDSASVLKQFETLRIWDRVQSALKWARLYGGAIAVMLIDGQDNSTPLRPETIARGQFKGLLVLDRHQIDPSVSQLVQAYGPDLGLPMFYRVHAGAKALAGQTIHYSRVIRLEGEDLPDDQRLTENGWGLSKLERVWDRLIAYDSTTAGTAQLVYKAHIRTLSVEKMREIVAGGGKPLEGLVASMEYMRRMQSNEGVTLIDSKDKFEAHSFAFSGLDKVLMQMGEQLSGAAKIPLVRLLGQSPSGLNADGESHLRTYYDGINQEQESRLRSPFSRLIDVTARSALGRPLPENYAWEFVSLWQLTPEQKANIAKTKTEAVAGAFDSGIIDQPTALKELQQVSKDTGVFSHIDDALVSNNDLAPPGVGEFGVELEPGDSLNRRIPGSLAGDLDDSLNKAAA